MKTSIAIITTLALAASFSSAEERSDKERKGKNPKQHFERIDTDQSGTISLAEFQATPRGQENPERAAKHFEHLDADKDGQLTMGEMASGMKKHHDPKAMFERLDADKSGSISLEEFQASPRGKKNPEGAATAFARLDADSDGQVTPTEMKAGHRKPGPGKDGKGGKKKPKGSAGGDTDSPTAE